jgi:hypothetical protein
MVSDCTGMRHKHMYHAPPASSVSTEFLLNVYCVIAGRRNDRPQNTSTTNM